MKKIIVIAALFFLYGSLTAQKEIILCEGTGVHCMFIDMNGIKINLVKAKDKPEIRIK